MVVDARSLQTQAALRSLSLHSFRVSNATAIPTHFYFIISSSQEILRGRKDFMHLNCADSAPESSCRHCIEAFWIYLGYNVFSWSHPAALSGQFTILGRYHK